MKNKYIILTAIFILTILGSCKETIVESCDCDSQYAYFQLSKNKCEFGEKIRANLINIDSIYVYLVTLYDKRISFSQINGNTVTLVTPISYYSGNFIFHCLLPNGSVVHDTAFISTNIEFEYESIPDENYIKWNTGEKITERDSWKLYSFQENSSWSLEETQDTIKLIRNYSCHDECGITETICFKTNGNDTLPKFLYAEYYKSEWMSPDVYEVIKSNCKIIVDEWKHDSIFSGTLSSEEYSWVFWYKN